VYGDIKMTVQFREKALMAYETMPSSQKNRVSKVIKQLDVDKSQSLKSDKLEHTDTWMVRVDGSVRLLFKETDQGFLIIDIIDSKKEYY
jgi:mRNA-degrading endonuclease RelE of RelBE toxin-antitoxin system